MKIEVVYALPERQKLITLELAEGTTAREAAQASALHEEFPELDLSAVPLGIFGEKVKDDYLLQPGDRVELYRKLLIDPMEARRRRAGGR